MRDFLRTVRRLTIVEWLVIIGVVLVGLAVLVPGFPIDFDAPPKR